MATIAFVREVTAASTARGSMFAVRGSTSTKTGVPPAYSTALDEERKVRGVVMTSSPGPMPAASIARCNEAVQWTVATTAGTPRYSSNFFSKS